MEAATRPAVSCCCRAVSSRTASSRLLLNTTPAGARHQSTTSRTKKALIVPPHASFFKLGSGDHAARRTTDQIIFNPPAAAPSVYHTPFKFLPKSDPRRRANLASQLFASQSPSTTSSATSTETTTAGPSVEDFPALENYQAPSQKPHHLTKEDIEELRRLRAEDPVANSVQNLARKFKCSKLFVLMCCRAPREHQDKVRAQEEAVKARWGPKRRQAREERARRMGMLFNGEL